MSRRLSPSPFRQDPVWLAAREEYIGDDYDPSDDTVSPDEVFARRYAAAGRMHRLESWYLKGASSPHTPA